MIVLTKKWLIRGKFYISAPNKYGCGCISSNKQPKTSWLAQRSEVWVVRSGRSSRGKHVKSTPRGSTTPTFVKKCLLNMEGVQFCIVTVITALWTVILLIVSLIILLTNTLQVGSTPSHPTQRLWCCTLTPPKTSLTVDLCENRPFGYEGSTILQCHCYRCAVDCGRALSSH